MSGLSKVDKAIDYYNSGRVSILRMVICDMSLIEWGEMAIRLSDSAMWNMARVIGEGSKVRRIILNTSSFHFSICLTMYENIGRRLTMDVVIDGKTYQVIYREVEGDMVYMTTIRRGRGVSVKDELSLLIKNKG